MSAESQEGETEEARRLRLQAEIDAMRAALAAAQQSQPPPPPAAAAASEDDEPADTQPPLNVPPPHDDDDDDAPPPPSIPNAPPPTPQVSRPIPSMPEGGETPLPPMDVGEGKMTEEKDGGEAVSTATAPSDAQQQPQQEEQPLNESTDEKLSSGEQADVALDAILENDDSGQAAPDSDKAAEKSADGTSAATEPNDKQPTPTEESSSEDAGTATTASSTVTSSVTFAALPESAPSIPEDQELENAELAAATLSKQVQHILDKKMPTTSISCDKAEEPRQSLRDRLKRKLRAKEKKFTDLMRNASGDGDSLLTQMKNVREKMEQVEQEKSELEVELNRMKAETDDDDFLKEKMQGIQDGFEKQVKKIQSLQHEIMAKNTEIDNLRTELVKKLQRIVELEFDLETHEVHYTQYAEEQFKLGEDALAEIKGSKRRQQRRPSDASIGSVSTIGDDASVVSTKSTRSTRSTRSSRSLLGRSQSQSQPPQVQPHIQQMPGTPVASTPKQAQRLISKLLSDLDTLEIRYKEEKLRSESSIEKLRLDNTELQTRVQMLEKRLKQTGDFSETEASESKGAESFEQHSFTIMRRRADRLEAKAVLYQKEIQKLTSRLEDARSESEGEAKRAEYALTKLENENTALKARIEQLEAKGRRKSKMQLQAHQAFASLETKIEQNYHQIVRLQNSVEIKDRQISTLKKEVANLRMKEISEGNTKDTPYTRQDTEILRASAMSSNRKFAMATDPLNKEGEAGGGAPGPNHAYIVELQRQLQEAQQQLVKKDQELVIERAKAASTAAGLLARITELTGKKVDTSQKTVPRRFYL